jgi:hypothetical protein
MTILDKQLMQEVKKRGSAAKIEKGFNEAIITETLSPEMRPARLLVCFNSLPIRGL